MFKRQNRGGKRKETSRVEKEKNPRILRQNFGKKKRLGCLQTERILGEGEIGGGTEMHPIEKKGSTKLGDGVVSRRGSLKSGAGGRRWPHLGLGPTGRLFRGELFHNDGLRREAKRLKKAGVEHDPRV